MFFLIVLSFYKDISFSVKSLETLLVIHARNIREFNGIATLIFPIFSCLLFGYHELFNLSDIESSLDGYNIGSDRNCTQNSYH